MSTENLTTNLSDLLPVTEHESEGIYTDDEDDDRRLQDAVLMTADDDLVGKLKAQVISDGGTIKNLKNKYKQSKLTASELKAQLRQKCQEEVASNEERDELKEQVERLRNNALQLSKEIDDMQQAKQVDAKQVTEKLRSKDEEITCLKKGIDVHQTENKELQDKNNSLTDENHQLKARILTQEELLNNDREDSSIERESQRRIIGENTPTEARVKVLVHEAKMMREEYFSEFVLPKHKIVLLDADTIRLKTSPAHMEKIDKALKAIKEMDLRMYKALCDNEQSPLKLNENLTNSLLNERKSCEHIKSQIKETKDNLLEDADQRNIKSNQYECRDTGNDYKDIEVFCGNGNLYVFEFLEQINNFLHFKRIPLDEGGDVIRKCVEGTPLKLINSKFPLEINPDFKAISELLIEHFGNRKLILENIKIKHEEIGVLAHTDEVLKFSEDEFRKEKDRAQDHLKLFERVVKLRKYDGNRAREKVHVDDYKETILKILPVNRCHELVQEKSNDGLMKIIGNTLKSIDMDMVHYSQDNIVGLRKENMTESAPEEEKNETSGGLLQGRSYMAEVPGRQRSKGKYFKKNIEFWNCEICIHMKKSYGKESENREHGMMISQKGQEVAIGITCPFIINLNMREKKKFLKTHKFCSSCIRTPIGPSHDEAKCKINRSYNTKCKDKNCKLHYLVCDTHRFLHENKILEKRNALLRAGINCKF